MNALRIATQGLRGGVVPLAIATQGFQPIREIVVSSGGGGLSRIHARQLRDDDDLLLMLAGLVASGALS